MGFVWIRLHQVFLYGVLGAYLPYIPVYLHELGLEDWQIGWVLGVWGIAVMVMPALGTHLADRHVSNRVLLALGYAGSVGALAVIASADRFAVFIAGSLIFSVAFTPLVSLLDGLTFAAMHEARRAGRRFPPFHRIRIWGSIGFMLPAFALFALLRWTALGGRAAIVAAAVIAGLGALTAMLLPRTPRADADDEGGGAAKRKIPSLLAWREVARPPARGLLASLFLLSVGVSILYTFYTRLLQDLGTPDEWLGLIVNLGVVAELPFVLGAGVLLRAIGLRGVVVLGAVSLLVRLALLAAVPSLAVAIATQALHGPLVLALYVVPPLYIEQKATPDFRNSMQGLYGVLCLGLARVVGATAGGHIAEDGLARAFGAGAILAAIAAAWLALGFRDAESDAALRAAEG